MDEQQKEELLQKILATPTKESIATVLEEIYDEGYTVGYNNGEEDGRTYAEDIVIDRMESRSDLD